MTTDSTTPLFANILQEVNPPGSWVSLVKQERAAEVEELARELVKTVEWMAEYIGAGMLLEQRRRWGAETNVDSILACAAGLLREKP